MVPLNLILDIECSIKVSRNTAHFFPFDVDKTLAADMAKYDNNGLKLFFCFCQDIISKGCHKIKLNQQLSFQFHIVQNVEKSRAKSILTLETTFPFFTSRRETLKGHDEVNGSQVAAHERVENQ